MQKVEMMDVQLVANWVGGWELSLVMLMAVSKVEKMVVLLD
jgi:hypothetical protein